jgi:DNA-binding response OmpR family regulator
MRLLIGEHNGQLQNVAVNALRSAGFGVDIAKTAAELRSVVADVNYELMILNASLFGGEGTSSEMVRALRQDGLRVPILVISGNVAVDQCVKILDSGADDCLAKPFNNRELLARVRALLRRTPGIPKSVLRVGNIEADEAEVRCSGKPVDLRLKERRLLTILLRQHGRVVPKEMLASALSDGDVSLNAIEALVSRVRARLRAVQSGIIISTVYGIGYRLVNAAGPQPVGRRVGLARMRVNREVARCARE